MSLAMHMGSVLVGSGSVFFFKKIYIYKFTILEPAMVERCNCYIGLASAAQALPTNGTPFADVRTCVKVI